MPSPTAAAPSRTSAITPRQAVLLRPYPLRRSGDFVQALFRNAHNPDELAFAIGALSHYIGDTVGHAEAINLSVVIQFPGLAQKLGSSVNYAENKHAHVQTEFAFDINQISKHRLAPFTYLRHIGIEVPQHQLAAAFYETYGIPIESILCDHRPTVRTYRFGVRSFLPRFAYAENVLHGKHFPPDKPGPQLDLYLQHLAQLAVESGWDSYRKRPGIGTNLLTGLIVVIPKIGPAALLATKGPTTGTEERYIESINRSTAALHLVLQHLAATIAPQPPPPLSSRPERIGVPGERSSLLGVASAAEGSASPPLPQAPEAPSPASPSDPARSFPKISFPTATSTPVPRSSPEATRSPTGPMPVSSASSPAMGTSLYPPGLREDVLRYYADPSAPISTRRKPQEWTQVQTELQILTSMPSVPPTATPANIHPHQLPLQTDPVAN
jgi:hypothetical protein